MLNLHISYLFHIWATSIHYRAKMRFHNRDNLINFVAVPGSYRNFYGKSG